MKRRNFTDLIKSALKPYHLIIREKFNMIYRMKFFVSLFFIFYAGLCFGQVKLPDSILSTLNTGHPRLMLKSIKDFEDLKVNITKDEFLRKVSKVLIHQADSLLSADTVKYVLANQLGGQLLEVSRTVYRRVYVLAMAYRLTGNKKYAAKVWGDLYSASRFPDWNPWHFLDTSEMLHGFAIGYDWLYEVWTPEQRKIIKQAIIDKGLLRAYMGYSGLENKHLVNWPKATSNWNQVCSGGVGLAALAIADEEPKLCNYLIGQVIQHIPHTMLKLAPDGATDEGPGYWKFGTQYNVALIASLETALGTDFGLSKIEGFSKTADYFLAMGSNSGKPFDYADCWTDLIQSPELFWFAKKYNQPLLASYQKKHPEYNVRELLWYDASYVGGKELPLDNYFRGAEVATMRSSWSDPKAWFVGFKAGSNTASHGHLDIGNFVLERNGKRWAMDLQHDTYDLPGYFDVATGQRWTYYRMKAEGHNTLVMNPSKQPDQNPKASTKIDRFVSGKSSTFGIMDMTNAYSPKVESAIRGIALQDKKQVLVQDEVLAATPVKDLYWFMQTAATIQLSANKRIAILTLDNEKLKVQIESPENASFEILEARPLSQSIQPQREDTNKGIKRLTIHLKDVSKTTIAVVYKDEGDHSDTIIKPLKNW
ncbi:heparinase II/III family protein [Pedobacter lithocola]|uniref:Heparinase II/III family protein n=2 Tax=Pedobacter lithocola TaxID=1908239 RepID=A0ABV8PGV1_9SPHI